MLQNFSIIKAIGIFATVVMIVLFFGPSIMNLTDSIRKGDTKGILINSGGRLLSLDQTLDEQTDKLLEETAKPFEETDVKKVSLDFAYAISTLFVYFLVFWTLFWLLNWIAGVRAFSMSFDLLIITFILGLFFFLEYLYGSIILGTPVYPLQGVYRFVTSTPEILRNLF